MAKQTFTTTVTKKIDLNFIIGEDNKKYLSVYDLGIAACEVDNDEELGAMVNQALYSIGNGIIEPAPNHRLSKSKADDCQIAEKEIEESKGRYSSLFDISSEKGKVWPPFVAILAEYLDSKLTQKAIASKLNKQKFKTTNGHKITWYTVNDYASQLRKWGQ